MPDGQLELARRDRPVELRLDPAVAADEKRPRLRRKMPLSHPAVLTFPRIVVLVDLDVDETDARAGKATAELVDHVDDGATGATRAVAWGREGDHERNVRAQRLGDGIAQQTPVGWETR